MTNKLSIIIPAAGISRRMRSYGPKSLLPIQGEALICRQIRVLGETFPKAEIIVVLGYEATKIRKVLPRYVKIVINAGFETNNVAASIACGLAIAKHDRVLVVYGDLVFDRAAVEPFKSQNGSTVLIAEQDELREGEVGVNVVDNHALYFSYGLPEKWGQMVMLTGLERRLFHELSRRAKLARLFTYEVMNLVLDYQSSSFDCIFPANGHVTEVDCSKDLENAQRIAIAKR